MTLEIRMPDGTVRRFIEKHVPPKTPKPKPHRKPMDAETKSLDGCAGEFADMPATFLIWRGNPDTGEYDGFDVVAAGKGLIGMVRLGTR